MMSRSVLVIGTHRSGTSMVAGFLHRLGVNMGDQLLGESVTNPRGHFEDVEFLALNDAVVKEWKWPKPAPTDKQKEAYAALCKQRERLPLWGMKDPRLCYTARYILPLLDDPVIVATNRSQETCARSLVRRDGMTMQEARSITHRYLEARRKTLAMFPDIPSFTVGFGEMRKEPETIGRDLAEFILPWEYAFSIIDTAGPQPLDDSPE